MARKQTSWFRNTIMVVLFTFSMAIAALFVADIAYVDAGSLVKAVTEPYLLHAFLLSLVTSVIAMVLAILVAVPSGYALSRYPFRGMIVLDVIIDALIVLPVLIIGISLLVFFREGSDLLIPGGHLLDKANELFSAGGFFAYLGGACLTLIGYALVGAGKTVSALGRFFIYHKPGIVLAQFFCGASYAVRVMKATFDEISPRTEQVAMTLGCSRAGAFARVTLPLARHGIVAAAVLSWARAISVYGPVQIVAGAVSGRTLVLPSAIYLEISIGQLRLALAMSILMIVTAFIVLLLLKLFSKASLFGSGGGE